MSCKSWRFSIRVFTCRLDAKKQHKDLHQICSSKRQFQSFNISYFEAAKFDPIGTSTFDLSSTSTEVLLRRWLRCVFRWPSRNLRFGNRALEPTVEGLHQRFVETRRSKQFCFVFGAIGEWGNFQKKPFRYGYEIRGWVEKFHEKWVVRRYDFLGPI